MDHNIFPFWVNRIKLLFPIVFGVVPVYLIAVLVYGAHPETTHQGYQPIQPVAFSHKLHAGELGMDCRYCHNTVDKAAFAAVPPTKTCWGCHQNIRANSPKITLIKESMATGESIDWMKVHDLPDYVYFNHSVHVARGVGCASCHGRIDKMEVVYREETLSMGWCLECHRQPEKHLRPVEFVTKMDYSAEKDLNKTQEEAGRELMEKHHIYPAVNCSTCHR